MGSVSFAQTWEPVNSTGTTFILYGMSFPPGQNNIGYASGMQYTWDAAGVIIKTTDGGDNWEPIWPASGSIDGVEGIWFLSEDVGFAAGWNNYFIKTTDGGESWSEVEIGGDYVWYWQDVVFWDNNNGVATAMTMDEGEAIFITDDGGDTWVRAISGSSDNIVRVTYANENTLYAVGLNGNVYKSTDKGHNWTTVNTLSGGYLMSIEFADENFGIIGGEELMYYTTDGGETWTMNYTGYEHFYGVKAFANGTAYWAGTERIYNTTDYGQNIEMEFDGGYNFASFYRVRSTDNGTLFASGSGGTIVKKAPSQTPLIVDFDADGYYAGIFMPVTFTDLSQGDIIQWNWVFEGGTPATSTEQHPVVIYEEYGSYDVTLTISDGINSATLTKEDMIEIGCVNVPTNSLPTLSLYPNPAGQMLNIRASKIFHEDTMLVITNILGQTVLTIPQVNCTSDIIQVDISKLAAGHYTVGIGNTTEGMTFQKLVILR